MKQPTDLTTTSKVIKQRERERALERPISYRLTNDTWHVKTIGNGDIVLIKALKKKENDKGGEIIHKPDVQHE